MNNIEEAKKKLNYYKQLLIAMDETETPNDFAKAIETVLQALENSISKDKVKEKIEKMNKIIEESSKEIKHRHTLIEASIIKHKLEKLLEDKQC